MLLGYFTNRVVFSIGVLFTALFVVTSKKWYLEILKDRYLTSFILLPFVVLLSDLIFVGTSVIPVTTFFTKMLLVLFPLLIWIWKPTLREIRFLHSALYFLLTINVLYSLYHYVLDKDQVVEAYKFAKVMKVLSLNDHIRISWLSSISIVLAIWDGLSAKSKTSAWVLWTYVFLQVSYLHFLSAKTGLLCLYTSLLIYSFFMLRRSSFSKALMLISIVVSLPIAGYFLFPSFQHRVNYVRWDFSEFLYGEGRAGLSDGNRFYSQQAGVSLFKENPQGIGFTNIRETTNTWYGINKTFMVASDYILPSSEFLLYAVGGGILGLFLLLLHFAMPFTYKEIWKNWLFPSVYIPALLTFVYETHFEGQLSLFVYGFFVFWVYYLAKSSLIK